MLLLSVLFCVWVPLNSIVNKCVLYCFYTQLLENGHERNIYFVCLLCMTHDLRDYVIDRKFCRKTKLVLNVVRTCKTERIPFFLSKQISRSCPLWVELAMRQNEMKTGLASHDSPDESEIIINKLTRFLIVYLLQFFHFIRVFLSTCNAQIQKRSVEFFFVECWWNFTLSSCVTKRAHARNREKSRRKTKTTNTVFSPLPSRNVCLTIFLKSLFIFSITDTSYAKRKEPFRLCLLPLCVRCFSLSVSSSAIIASQSTGK